MRISDWSSDVCSSDLLAESKPGVHMVAHAMKRHYLSIAIPMLFAAAGASLDARAAGTLTFVNETSQRNDALHDSASRSDALFVASDSAVCPDAFILSHSGLGAISRLWTNLSDGRGSFTYIPN